MNLTDFARNEYSQFGEDGILTKLFETIGIHKGYFVEFGAWDGIHFSNSHALYKSGWRGCYIEGDYRRFRSLEKNISDDRATKLNVFLEIHGDHSFDNLMERVGAPAEIDLISIDIDSDDLAVWRSIKNHAGKVVVIEYNPTIPFDTEFENVPGRNWGNSALSIVKFATSKSYDLVAVTTTNLVFVRRDIGAKAKIPTCDLHSVHSKARYFWGYDGSLICSLNSHAEIEEVFFLPWGRALAFQPVPKPLRVYANARSPMSVMRTLVTGVTVLCARPLSFLAFLARGLPRRRS